MERRASVCYIYEKFYFQQFDSVLDGRTYSVCRYSTTSGNVGILIIYTPLDRSDLNQSFHSYPSFEDKRFKVRLYIVNFFRFPFFTNVDGM